MNKIILIGRITKELDIKHTKNGKAIVSFDMAVKDSKKKNEDGSFGANFIRCKLLGSGAINLEKYTTKGSRICVCGELKVDVIKQEDGSNKFFSYVWVNEVEYLESKKSNQDNYSSSAVKEINEDNFNIDDEDLPF